jgi:hypothetical protein
LDKNHGGSIPIEQAVKDPIYVRYIAFSLASDQNYSTNATNNTTNIGALINLLFPEESSGSSSKSTNRHFADNIPPTSAAGFINIANGGRHQVVAIVLVRVRKGIHSNTVMDIKWAIELPGILGYMITIG